MTFLEENKLQPLFDLCIVKWNEYLGLDFDEFDEERYRENQSLIKDSEGLEFWFSEEFAKEYGEEFMLMTNDDQPQVAGVDPMSWEKVAKAKTENNKIIITEYI